MTKLDRLIAELCPDGVEYVTLGEIATRTKGTPITAAQMKLLDKPNAPVKIFAGGKTVPDNMKTAILDDLCVFYVGLTRAKRQAFISASAERFNAQGGRFINGKLCCFANVEGVEPVFVNPA